MHDAPHPDLLGRVGDENKSRWAERLGVFGDLPTRLLTHALRVVPWFLEPVLVAGWTFLFFLIAGAQRRAVVSNLRAMHPRWGRPRAVIGAWRVFWNFAVTFVDALRCETETGGVDWTAAGVANMDELAQLLSSEHGKVISDAKGGL